MALQSVYNNIITNVHAYYVVVYRIPGITQPLLFTSYHDLIFFPTACSRWTTLTTTNRASWSRVSWVRSTTPNRSWTWCSAVAWPACRLVPHRRRRRRSLRHPCPSPVWCTTIRRRPIPPPAARPPSHTIMPPPQQPPWSANSNNSNNRRPRPGDPNPQRLAAVWHRRPSRPSKNPRPWPGHRRRPAAACPLQRRYTSRRPPILPGTYRSVFHFYMFIYIRVANRDDN